MRIPTISTSGDYQFNMTPMIDVVFLLIIFFLVSSHLAKQESQIPLLLPQAETGQKLQDEATARVTVNILADGKIQLGGRSLPLDELRRRLEYELHEQDGQLQVRIRSDRNVPYQFVEPIMLICAKAGIWNVQISVVRHQESRS